MCKKKRNWARLGICSLFLGALVLGGLLLGAQPASAQTCIQQGTKSLVCTANDIQVAFANNIRDTSGNPLGQCTSGDTFSFIADFHVTTTASTRYDIGLYFATDGDPNGDGARTGVCSANIITPLHTDTASPGIVTLGSADGVNKAAPTPPPLWLWCPRRHRPGRQCPLPSRFQWLLESPQLYELVAKHRGSLQYCDRCSPWLAVKVQL